MSPAAWVALGAQLAPDGEVVALLARDPIPELPGRSLAWRASYATRGGAPRMVVSLRPQEAPGTDV